MFYTNEFITRSLSPTTLKSINFVVLGDPKIAAELGKKGTSTDITIYDRKTADSVYTWSVPTTDKIQSLMQAVNIAEYAILNVVKLDKSLGEQIMALDAVGLVNGFVMHSYEVDREKLQALLKGTSLGGYRFIDSLENLKLEINKLESRGLDGPLTIPIDHAFDVKGVGTVALGVVKRGNVKVYDELTIFPEKKVVLVKSIQMHDDSVQSSSSPSRVGLAVKGINADEISRGDVLGAPSALMVSGETITVNFIKSPFFKGDLPENHTYMVSVGMQVKTAKIKLQGGILQVSTEKPIAYNPGQTLVLLKPDSQGTRIAGKGSIQ